MNDIIQEHQSVFIGMNNPPWDDLKPIGMSPYEFSKKLGISDKDLKKYGLYDGGATTKFLSRNELKILCESAKTDSEITGAILSVLAWGGMSHGNPKRFWNSPDGLNAVVTIIRKMKTYAGQLDPIVAFSWFAKARSEGKLKGMAISYYTKILFFFFPSYMNIEAPIFDQFTAKSINVLFSDCPIPMQGDFPKESQKPEKSTEVYRQYLNCIDILRRNISTYHNTPCSRGQMEYLGFPEQPIQAYSAPS